MHGQGTLRWASGERYDGEWVEGEEHGLGVFTWRDGTTYDGFWQFGKKHGIGVCHRTVRCMSWHRVSDSILADILPCATSMHKPLLHLLTHGARCQCLRLRLLPGQPSRCTKSGVVHDLSYRPRYEIRSCSLSFLQTEESCLPTSCAIEMQLMIRLVGWPKLVKVFFFMLQVYRTSQPELKRQATAASSTGDPSVQPQAPTNSESPISAPSLSGPGELMPP